MTQALTEQKTLTLSFILEWDNARLSELARCKCLMKELYNQINEIKTMQPTEKSSQEEIFLSRFHDPFECIILYDPKEVDEGLIRSIVDETIPKDNENLFIRYVQAEGQRYYQLKNSGVKHSKADIISFIDSDIIVQPGWLKNLLGSFSNPDVDVICGSSFIDAKNVYEKAFALGWFFNTKMDVSQLEPAKGFFAHNVAFKREILNKYPFKDIPYASRGACTKLAQTLLENGYSIYRHTGSQACHPPPNGLRHYFMRPLAGGRDHYLRDRAVLGPEKATFRRSFWRYRHMIGRRLKSIITNRKKVNLSLFGVPVALSIMILFYCLYLAGDIVTRISPAFTEKYFKL